MSETIERLLSTDDVARILGITPKHVRNLPIRFVRVGVRKRRYDEADLRKFIADQKQEGKACQSTSARARRITTRSSKSAVIGFAEALKLRPAERL